MSKLILGKTVMTQGIDVLIKEKKVNFNDVMLCLAKHSIGDWGIVSEQDTLTNQEALINGDSVMSVYEINNIKIWVITESDRSCSTILLPNEY